ncbi:sensor histidine kinase [Sneathiella glossodoripedis]|uniref:sensor histidine kinase n=1 Tax=Sneathiella glossodoripedis TaxID=418853 RepID=UPI0004709B40|nr:ATP-binding protein [Sneathiella glossodoripedis]
MSLINELLDLAKIEAGAIQLNEQKTDLFQITQSCKTMLTARASERNINVHTSVVPAELYIQADPIRLKQILVNLAGNAVKFSNHGGNVHISWSCSRGRIILEVKDDGVGIEQEFIPELFQPLKEVGLRKI